MKTFIGRIALISALTFALTTLSAQTLIINEVSQGESGNKEYIELIVVDSAANYNCAITTPPTIDIRHWIIDDNSGHHGASGIAPGAVRFSNDITWSAVPLGTIILLYNPADFNPEIPSGTVTLADGTCRITAPITDTQLFESNTTTPGAVACSYPATGWTSGGDWSHITLRNAGDCARIVDLSGCEVFSVCWGDVDQNTVIHFTGSASRKVFYFNNGDPTVQANWSSGCANLSYCGSQDQTPSAANNTANTSYIGGYNNNCMPITPINTSINLIQAPYCIDNGVLSATATGSIPNYSYQWYNFDYSTQLDSISSLDSISAGTYNVVATSAIGCNDTASITISAIDTTIELTLSDTSICSPQLLNLTGNPSISGGEFNWNNQGNTTSNTFSVNVTQTTTYPVLYTLGTCSVDSTITVQIGGGQVSAGNDTTICEGNPIFLSGTDASSYTWSNGQPNGAEINLPVGQNELSVIGDLGASCESFDTMTVTVIPNPVPNITPSTTSGNAPLSINFANNSTNATAFNWDFGNGAISTNQNESTTYSQSGVYTVNLILNNDFCSTSWQQQITVESPVEPLTVKIPNVFSPNGDGTEDFYYLTVQNAQSLEAVILNRWGNEIVHFTKLDDVWDGTFHNQQVSEGTYFIRYKVVGNDNSIQEGHTFFQLIR